jgi:hypothetical protein
MSSAGLTFIATSFATALLTALHFHVQVPNYPKLEVEVEGCVHEKVLDHDASWSAHAETPMRALLSQNEKQLILYIPNYVLDLIWHL